MNLAVGVLAHIWQKSDLLRFSVFTLSAFLKDIQQLPGNWSFKVKAGKLFPLV